MVLVSGTEIFSENEWMALVEEVIRCLFLGYSDRQIALKLQMAVPTVRSHLSRLFSRFDVEDRTELVLYVFSRFRQEYSHL